MSMFVFLIVVWAVGEIWFNFLGLVFINYNCFGLLMYFFFFLAIVIVIVWLCCLIIIFFVINFFFWLYIWVVVNVVVFVILGVFIFWRIILEGLGIVWAVNCFGGKVKKGKLYFWVNCCIFILLVFKWILARLAIVKGFKFFCFKIFNKVCFNKVKFVFCI